MLSFTSFSLGFEPENEPTFEYAVHATSPTAKEAPSQTPSPLGAILTLPFFVFTHC